MTQLNGFPYDPLIDVIRRDVGQSRAFKQSIQHLTDCIVSHGNTLHPSDDLLEAWYRFKENQICQR